MLARLAQASLLVAAAQAHGNHGHGGSVSGDDLPWGLAFGLNFAAAVSTLVGAGAVICNATLRDKLNDPTSPILVRCLSFSAGILLWVSLVVLQPEGKTVLYEGKQAGSTSISTAFFFAGWGLGVFLQDQAHRQGQKGRATTVQPAGRKDDTEAAAGTSADQFAAQSNAELRELGLHTALSLGLHNFAEGFVSFVVVLVDRKIGVATAVAIMLHNIPEGFVIAAPVYASSNGSVKEALALSSLATGAEVFAGFLVWCILQVATLDSGSSEFVWLQASLSCLAAGIMAQATLGSLLPQCLSREHKRQLALRRAASGDGDESGSSGGGGVPMNAIAAEGQLEAAAGDAPAAGGGVCCEPAADERKTSNKVVVNAVVAGLAAMAIVLALFDINAEEYSCAAEDSGHGHGH